MLKKTTIKRIIKRSLQVIGISTVVGTALCSYFHPIQLKGQITRTIFKKLKQKQLIQRYGEYILKTLIHLQFVKNNGSIDLSKKILTGIDRQGSYIRNIQLLGINGIEVGPVSQSPDSQLGALGIRNAKANINTYVQQRKYKKNKNKQYNIQDNSKQLLIGIQIQPDRTVLQYTPYIITQNIITSVRQITGIPEDLLQAEQKVQFLKKTHGDSITDRQLNVLLPKINNNIVDFITIDSQKIKDRLGPENAKESNIILRDIFNKVVGQIAQPKKIKIFQKKNNQHHVVFYPLVDRHGQSTRNQKHQFITVRDIINQILRD